MSRHIRKVAEKQYHPQLNPEARSQGWEWNAVDAIEQLAIPDDDWQVEGAVFARPKQGRHQDPGLDRLVPTSEKPLFSREIEGEVHPWGYPSSTAQSLRDVWFPNLAQPTTDF